MHFVAALLTMSEPGDLGRAVGNSDATWHSTVGLGGRGETRSAAGERVELGDQGAEFQPTVFLYDNYPGGIGLSAPIYDLRERVIAGATHLVDACECQRGCPACIGPILGSDESGGVSPKSLAQSVLRLLAPQTRAD